MTKEEIRLLEDKNKKKYWRKWGPYLSERQWGTVREDYSQYGTAWDYFTHDQALSRAYRWGEDGIAGISDNHQRLCFSIAMWNGKDPIIKERLFGLTGSEGNHGEDVKEYYFYLDNTPTHSYMKYLYKYPHSAYPYSMLVDENRARSRKDSELELLDTGIFNENRYFDVLIEYAKNNPDDLLIRITATNRGPDEAVLHLLPTLWFRNTWSWNTDPKKPCLKKVKSGKSNNIIIEAEEKSLGKLRMYFEHTDKLLFTENETDFRKLYGVENGSKYYKDGINNYIINGTKESVNPENEGTKVSIYQVLILKPGTSEIIKFRLTDTDKVSKPLGNDFDSIFEIRIKEADEFYDRINPFEHDKDTKNIQRQAYAGMLWCKQYFNYVVNDWLNGDPCCPPPPEERKSGRNSSWLHVYSEDILSMPDKWEYPWFAAWDLAFHTVPLVMIDPEFAKRQLMLLTREWYMHPNGQIPAYEWAFGDVNPPVHAWAAWRIYNIERKMYGNRDIHFLESVFQKLLLNFTWWVNRKDSTGRNIFEGGFLGLDNIGVFDRSSQLPTGGYIEQADGTGWMGMYSLNMLAIAMELAKQNPVYEDIASKFYEHFIYIADAMNKLGGKDTGLWDEGDGFYYDVLSLPDGSHMPMKVRSIVGLIPMFAIQTIEPDILGQLPDFKKRLEWFIDNRPDLKRNVACMRTPGQGERRLLSIVDKDKLRKILTRMLDEKEFLSPYGIRAISRFHKDNPYIFKADGREYRVDYEPAESTTGLFGGNSNWRGPIWFPINFLIIETLQKFHYYLGDDFRVECPTGSGVQMNLWEVASNLSGRLIKIFQKNTASRRPVFGGIEKFQSDPEWSDNILFHEYFHGDNGAGIGASHQTGWTGLVAKLIQQCGEYCTSDN